MHESGSSKALLRRMLDGKSKEEKSKKRKTFQESRIQKKRFPDQTLLEQEAISNEVANDYMIRMQAFRVFVKQEHLSIKGETNLDNALTYYLNYLFEEGHDLGDGTKTLAAILDSHPGCGQRTRLPRSRRALQGWNRLDPQKTRPPLPWGLVALIALELAKEGHIIECLTVLLSFVAYLRPGEALSIRKQDLILPNRSSNHYAINLHPSNREEESKMGLSDECILLDSRVVPWLGPALRSLRQRKGFALLQTSLPTLRKLWQNTLQKIGLSNQFAVLYQLRHAGPSHDRLTRARSSLEVKLRGRWTSDASVRRYERHAWVGQVFQSLPKKTQQAAIQAQDDLYPMVQKSLGLDRTRKRRG